MTEATKEQILQLAITNLDKEFGKGSVIKLGDADILPVPSISTGALNLDLALGIGGFPQGRIVEIYGPESSGKSTLALNVVAAAQAMGLTCAYIDAEQAMDLIYAKKVGVDVDELLFSQPEYGEKAFAIVDRLVRTQEVNVIVVDSVAALTPKAEIEGGMEKLQMGELARLMAKGLRLINGVLTQGDNKTMIIFINQLREKIGIMFGNPETTPGGRALKFYSSVRIDLRKIEDLKDKNGVPNGSKVKAKVVKNKVGPPLRVVEFDIIYGVGVDKYGCIADLAVERGLIKKSGAWYKDPTTDDVIAQGRDSLVEFLKNDLDLADKLENMIKNG